MDLREQLRNEWAMYIRPLMMKEECEWCGCKENLHLHHIDRFHNLLVETLEELQLQELNLDEYEEFELKQISNFMLAKQLKSEYKTLCKECHMKLHAKEKFTDEYKNHYYNPNGGYIIVNSEELSKLNIDDNMLVRFLQICCHCNYDGVLTNKRRKIRFNNFWECEYLINILGLKKAEFYNTINYLIDMKLINIIEDTLAINKKYVSKGFINFKTKYKIFQDNYISLYNELTPREHKTVGSIIKCDIENKRLITINFPTVKSNASKFRNKAVEIGKGYFKVEKKEIFISPCLAYKGTLDYSYKNAIEKFNKIDSELNNENELETA